MAEFTLLKLEFADASLTANTPFGGSGESDSADEEGDEESGGVLPLLLGLVFLVVLAVVVRKFLGGDDADELELDQV